MLNYRDYPACRQIQYLTLNMGRENPSYSRIFDIYKGVGLPISLVVQIDDGSSLEIIQESANELIRFLKKASNEERLKFQQMAFILQRLSKWKE